MKRVLTLALTASILLPTGAYAAGTAVVEAHGAHFAAQTSHDSRSRISWLDAGHVRMEVAGTGSYILEHRGKLYSVTRIKGQTRVLDMASMMKMAQTMGKSDRMAKAAPGSIGAIDDTGKTRTVAGIEGKVYTITVTDGRGKTRTGQWVLSDDARVRDMTKAYLGMMLTMVKSIRPDTNADRWLSRLPHPYDGILAMGDRFKLVSISNDAPEKARFDLPAKPMNLGGLLGAMQK